MDLWIRKLYVLTFSRKCYSNSHRRQSKNWPIWMEDEIIILNVYYYSFLSQTVLWNRNQSKNTVSWRQVEILWFKKKSNINKYHILANKGMKTERASENICLRTSLATLWFHYKSGYISALMYFDVISILDRFILS